MKHRFRLLNGLPVVTQAIVLEPDIEIDGTGKPQNRCRCLAQKNGSRVATVSTTQKMSRNSDKIASKRFSFGSNF